MIHATRSVDGENLRILRGDLHRHTEFSMDIRGIPDGSVLDFYRYMLDAASMDFGMISDHQNGSDREYWWWLEEKLADLFHSPDNYDFALWLRAIRPVSSWAPQHCPRRSGSAAPLLFPEE